jgi:hypothetical protein
MHNLLVGINYHGHNLQLCIIYHWAKFTLVCNLPMGIIYCGHNLCLCIIYLRMSKIYVNLKFSHGHNLLWA